ncbi:MAG: immunoglobulin domain-containing protein [Phycisphaerae bacterium]
MHRCVGFVSVLVAAAQVAWAQPVNPNPANAPVRSVDPDASSPGRVLAPVYRAGIDPPSNRPKFPDVDLKSIPPMPMPEWRPTPPIPPQDVDDTVTLYDASTGRVHRLPLAGTGMPSATSDAPYQGEGPLAAEGATTDWSATMSAVSAATLTTYPARANVKLIMQFTDTGGTVRMFTCSGSMQDGGVVLTAAHCVYARNPNGLNIFDWADRIWVIPAWDGAGNNGFQDPSGTTLENYGWASGTEYIAGTDYVNNGNWDRDAAMIRLNRTNSRSVGMLTGWYGWSWGNCSTSTTHYNYSYPAEGCSSSLHTGRQMYFWADQPDGCPGLFSNQYSLSTPGGCLNAVWGGMSGSGMYYISSGSRYVGAVCSTSNRSTSGNYCGLWEQFTIDLETFKTNTRGATFDVEALDYTVGSAQPTVRQGDDIPAGSVLLANTTNNNPAARNFTLRVYLSSNDDISTADTLIGTYNYSNVDFGAMDSIRFNIPATTVPYGTSTGTRYVGVIIDSATDGNSANNDTDLWDAQPITVQACLLPAAPTGLIATDQEFCDRVRLTWNAAAGATQYKIYRNTVVSTSGASLLGVTSALQYDDLTASSTGTGYYYWVRTVDGCGEGTAYSASAYGYRTTALLTAPSVVAATDGASCADVTVTWNSQANADIYYVYRNTVNSSTGAAYLGSSLSLAYTDASASAGVMYYYFVRGGNECGIGPFSASDAGYRQAIPVAPAAVSASQNNCLGVSVSWGAVSNATTYSVYRNTANTTLGATLVASPSSTSYLDTATSVGVSYYYWVRAGNACGTGPYSTSLVRAGLRIGSLLPPTNVVAIDNTVCADSTKVSWDPVSFAATYSVHRYRVGVGPLETLAANHPSTTFFDSTAFSNTQYIYYVRSVNACGATGDFSVGDTGNRGGMPNAVTNLAASDGSACNSVVVTWTNSAGATSYRITRNTANNFATSATLGTSPSSSFVDSTAAAGTTYFYWVVAQSSCGNITGNPDTGRAGGTVAFSSHPSPVTVDEGQPASFSVVVGGATAWQWRRNGVILANGGAISGATGPTLTINPATPADAGNYKCIVTSPCGSAASNDAALTVNPAPPCFADFNSDGGIDGDDVVAFYMAWEAGDSAADVNQDGGVDGGDSDTFYAAWESGGC